MIRSYAEGITASCLRRICRLFLVSDIFVCLLVHAAYGASAGVVHSGTLCAALSLGKWAAKSER